MPKKIKKDVLKLGHWKLTGTVIHDCEPTHPEMMKKRCPQIRQITQIFFLRVSFLSTHLKSVFRKRQQGKR